ncbi:alpha-ketoglutarate-dependent dioxygenase AlkB [Nostoc sp. RF31YmG]|nr:alpha-ketoglutarate-dependent dioxygenase AlkB [Nostoc sp. RF31YmG]
MQQLTLFPSEDNPPVEYIPNFLTPAAADELYNHCQQLEWQQNTIKMVGKTIPVPRLECAYGDAGCDYLYSKSVLLKPLPWTAELLGLRFRLESQTGYRFNLVICNRYRTGLDSIGWHADNEPSMGTRPAIASVTLGATRKFQLRPNSGGKPTDFWLEHGSLLLMKPGCQESWVHQVPKTSKPAGERINLTFRPHINGVSIAIFQGSLRA